MSVEHPSNEGAGPVRGLVIVGPIVRIQLCDHSGPVSSGLAADETIAQSERKSRPVRREDLYDADTRWQGTAD